MQVWILGAFVDGRMREACPLKRCGLEARGGEWDLRRSAQRVTCHVKRVSMGRQLHGALLSWEQTASYLVYACEICWP